MNNSLNLPEINQEQALYLTQFFIRAQKNFFLFGRRGTGKTEIALQAIKECGFQANYINLSVIERTDLAGYPDLFAKNDTITFKSATFIPKLIENAKPNLVFLFDEVDKAPPEITAPLLEILQFGKINGQPLNMVSCIMTGNLMNEGAYSHQISSALLDRGAKYILSFELEKWLAWARKNEINDLITGFLRANPEMMCGKLEHSVYADPSPRGWTLASNTLNQAKIAKLHDIETVSQLISGFVGSQAGLRFKMWYEYYRQYEPHILSLIEKGGMTFEYDKLMPSEKLVFVITTCYFAKQNLLKSKKFKGLENLCDFFIKYKIDRELQVVGLCNSFDFDMVTKYELFKCEKFFTLFESINIK